MKYLSCLFTIILLSLNIDAQNYIIPTIGTQTITTCSGYLFDSGGPTGEYQDNEDGTVYIIPDAESKILTLTVDQLNLENCCDELGIFENNLPSNISYSNVSLGDNVISTHDEGKIAVTFGSDGSVTSSGFRISIGCLTMNDTTDLMINDISFPDNIVAGININTTLNVFNDGMDNVEDPVKVKVFINNINDFSSATLIDSFSISGLARGNNSVEAQILLPGDIEDGNYYIFADLDVNNNVEERDENNNIYSELIYIEEANIDLLIRDFNYNGDYFIDSASTFNFNVESVGNAECGLWELETFISKDRILDLNDLEIENVVEDNYYNYSAIISLPESIELKDSLYNLIIKLVPLCNIQENDTANNYIIKPVIYSGMNNDLSIISLEAPETIINSTSNNRIEVEILNSGIYSGYTDISFYLSNDDKYDENDDINIHSYNQYLYPNINQYSFNYNPPTDTTGEYFIICIINQEKNIKEKIDSNNIKALNVNIAAPVYDIKLHKSDILIRYDQSNIYVNYVLKNQGNTYVNSVYTGFYLSNDATLDGSDILLDYSYSYSINSGFSTAISDNVSYSTIITNKYLIIKADYNNNFTEVNEANNIAVFNLNSQNNYFDFIYRTKRVITANKGIIRDNGGSGNYSNSSADTIIIMPETPGKKISLSIEMLNLDSYDYLEIYSGSLSNGNAVLINTISYNNENVYISDDASGAISLVFFSDASYNYSGLELRFDTTEADIYLEEIITSRNSYSPGESFEMYISSEYKYISQSSGIAYGFYISTDSVLSADDYLMEYYYNYNYNDFSVFSNSLALPSSIDTGTYYIICKADYQNNYDEGDELNNIQYKKIKVNKSNLDLSPYIIELSNSILLKDKSYYSDLYIYKSGNQTLSNISCNLYLSSDDTLDVTDLLLDNNNVSFSSGSNSNQTYFYYNLSDDIPDGLYYLIATVNDGFEIDETDTTNNILSTPVAIITEQNDLTILSFNVPATISSSGYSYIPYSISNQGITSASGYRFRVYLSNDSTFDGSDIFLNSYYYSSEIEVYQQFNNDIYINLSGYDYVGDMYLIGAVEEYYNSGHDIDTTNNIIIQPVEITLPYVDLSVYASSVPANVTSGQNSFYTEYIINNTGNDNAYPVSFELYLSTDSIINYDDILLDYYDYNSVYSNSYSYYYSTIYMSQIPASGTFYLIARIDHDNDISDANDICISQVNITYSYSDLYISKVFTGIKKNSIIPQMTIGGYVNYGNTGNASAYPSLYLFLSSDDTLDNNDVLVYSYYLNYVNPGDYDSIEFSFTTPHNITSKHEYLIAYIYDSYQTTDISPNNNFIVHKLTKNTVKVDEISPDNNFKLYPNPVYDKLIINSNNYSEYNLQLVDNTGRIIFETNVTNSEYSLNMQDFEKGVYYIIISDDKNNIVVERFKIIKL